MEPVIESTPRIIIVLFYGGYAMGFLILLMVGGALLTSIRKDQAEKKK